MIRSQLIATIGLCVVASAAIADNVVLTTAASPFPGSSLNQGWWSDIEGNQNFNTSYFMGSVGGGESRNFFTFDLAPLTSHAVISSATLRLVQPAAGPLFGNPDQTVGLYDVSTAANVLNANDGVSGAIFADLGSGSSYGTFFLPGVSGLDPFVRDFALNAVAIDDMQDSLNGFFSIGGKLESLNGFGALFVNDGTPDIAAELIVEYTIPEPMTTTLVIFGLATGVLCQPRRR
jgi:hypothetical protein